MDFAQSTDALTIELARAIGPLLRFLKGKTMEQSSHNPTIGCFLVVALATVSLVAQRPESSGPPKDLAPDSTTILGITLGQSNLSNVQAKFGAAKMWGDGDASSAEGKVCYVTQQPDPLAVIFASNSEMAPGGEVTAIRVLKRDDYKDRSRCLPLALRADDISTASGIRIGVNREKVRAILGPPTENRQTQWTYSREVERPIPKSAKNYQAWLARRQECFEGKEPFFWISSDITVRFKDDLVEALIFSRIDTYC
jgi:hypothetical protein